VSLPDELAEQARQAVGEGRAASVSGYIAGAMTQSARTRSITGLLADMRAEDGHPSEEDYAWADRRNWQIAVPAGAVVVGGMAHPRS
jgi:hypothetical protein